MTLRRADLVGGVTTFIAMAYIVIVNPTILSSPGTGIPFSGALTATVLYAIAGRRREVPAMLWILAVISVGLLVLER